MAHVISSTVLQNHLCTVCMYMAMVETFMAIYGLPRFRAILVLYHQNKTAKSYFLCHHFLKIFHPQFCTLNVF